ncbi:hypothetical protein BDZ94DRAFT_522539 [Collybia nuda]|uniref:Uncharacterized protein n=1 Tax=Collybia nuda TaxID=64659 RepID=A0A9P5YAJ1_9AGAR|nr:hypothetical protein BDZ94DRAFT_522539 [Collybia nuda]
MESPDLIQKLREIGQLLHHTHELCNDQDHHIIEEQNERGWHRSEKDARWNEMLRNMEKIRGTSDLLEIIQLSHQDRLDAVAKVFEDFKVQADSQREEALTATRTKKKHSR